MYDPMWLQQTVQRPACCFTTPVTCVLGNRQSFHRWMDSVEQRIEHSESTSHRILLQRPQLLKVQLMGTAICLSSFGSPSLCHTAVRPNVPALPSLQSWVWPPVLWTPLWCAAGVFMTTERLILIIFSILAKSMHLYNWDSDRGFSYLNLLRFFHYPAHGLAALLSEGTLISSGVPCNISGFIFIVISIFKIFIYLFLERGKGGRKRERNTNVWLPLSHLLLGTWPATQACSLTGNWTGNPLVCRPALNPLSHTSQGSPGLY